MVKTGLFFSFRKSELLTIKIASYIYHLNSMKYEEFTFLKKNYFLHISISSLIDVFNCFLIHFLVLLILVFKIFVFIFFLFFLDSALRTPHSALRTPHSALRTPRFRNSHFFVKKFSLSRHVGYVMDGWISERCMYVTPIRLDLLLNTNQISCSKGIWYVRRFDPDTVQNGHCCSYNFHMYRFSRYGKGEVDVYRFMSKYSSDHHVLFCHTSPSMRHHA